MNLSVVIIINLSCLFSMFWVFFFYHFQVMLLRNHGIVVCGGTIEEAFYLAENAVRACKFQVKYFNVCKTKQRQGLHCKLMQVYLQVSSKS